MKLLIDNRVKNLHESCENSGDILLHQHNELVPPLRGYKVGSRTGQLFRGSLKEQQTEGNSLWSTDKLEGESKITNIKLYILAVR